MTKIASITDDSYVLRVLIVEDSQVLTLELEQMISDVGMAVVGVAAQSANIMPIVGATRPDVVLMDVGLDSDISGIDAAIELRRDHDIPSIFITGYTGSEIMTKAQAAKPIAYLTKPLATRHLIALLRELQRVRRSQPCSS